MRPAIDPEEAGELLRRLGRHGFGAWHLGRNPAQPSLIVLFRQHGAWVDVVHLRGADRAEAARMPPADEPADIWRPAKVAWLHIGGAIEVLSALRRLVKHGSRTS